MSIILIGFMTGFASASQGVGKDCNTGVVAWIIGDTCAIGLKCNTTETPEVTDKYTGICRERPGSESAVFNFIKGILTPKASTGVEGDTSAEDNVVWDKILIFFLVFLVIIGILSSAGIFNKFINLGTSLVISIIGMRYLPNDIIYTLLSPTTALIALITAGIPFLVVFLMTNKVKIDGSSTMSTPTKRIVWALYLVFLGSVIISNMVNRKGLDGINLVLLFFLVFAIVMLVWPRAFFSIFYRTGLTREKDELESEYKSKYRDMTLDVYANRDSLFRTWINSDYTKAAYVRFYNSYPKDAMKAYGKYTTESGRTLNYNKQGQ